MTPKIIVLTEKSGDKILINLTHVISIFRLFDHTEIATIKEYYQVTETPEEIIEIIKTFNS